MTAGASTVVPLYPQVEFPPDPKLPDLPKLFDPAWVWPAFRENFGDSGSSPQQIQIRQFSHSLGRSALVSYVVDWDPEEYLPSEHFVARLELGRGIELFQFPNDPDLPGLPEVVDPESALKLLKRHVLAIGARRVRVEVVRYRPGNRAVLRYRMGKVGFFARVIRPGSLPAFLQGWELIGGSDFVAPRIAGYWADGGVVWMSEIPGKNLRSLIRRGLQPDPEPIFRGLETLWGQSGETQQGIPFNLSGAYRRAKGSLGHAAGDNLTARANLEEIAESLDPFVASWRPAGIAHNDFYDDQLLMLPDGRMALVDFEEAGPGDPMLDVGNFLAHLKWASRFGTEKYRADAGAYYETFRSAALERYLWDEGDLNLREALWLFRVSTNAVRQIRQDWNDRLEAALSLVKETLA